jgi:hypothetical protein
MMMRAVRHDRDGGHDLAGLSSGQAVEPMESTYH